MNTSEVLLNLINTKIKFTDFLDSFNNNKVKNKFNKSIIESNNLFVYIALLVPTSAMSALVYLTKENMLYSLPFVCVYLFICLYIKLENIEEIKKNKLNLINIESKKYLNENELLLLLLNHADKDFFENNFNDLTYYVIKNNLFKVLIEFLEEKSELTSIFSKNIYYIIYYLNEFKIEKRLSKLYNHDFNLILEENFNKRDLVELKKEIIVGDNAKNLKEYVDCCDLFDNEICHFLDGIGYVDENVYLIKDRLKNKEKINLEGNLILNDLDNKLIASF